MGRSPDEEVKAFIEGNGYEVYFVEGDDPQRMHQQFAATLDTCYARIRAIQKEARSPDGSRQKAVGSSSPGESLPAAGRLLPSGPRPRWPAIVLRTPKGWTGPKEVDGEPIEGTFRAHQVPLADVRTNEEQLALLETWLRSYEP